ncbi:MAG: lipid-A-disaccharide synthase [Phycisphaerales bacterium]|nr:MAG: lipid-A-disaccharide synthase [Phycisphaerales bacterium]
MADSVLFGSHMQDLLPSDAQGNPLIFISAAEPSADLHGASLIRATRALCPEARFAGVAGPKMQAEGCWPIFDMSHHAAMLLGALGAVGRAIAMMRTCDAHLRLYPFDAAVVIDSPMVHLPLAGRAQSAGVPVMYYIAPQMWAWGSYRIYKLRHRTDKVAVILPFEEEYFRHRGIDARYVGHPLMDHLQRATISAKQLEDIRGEATPFVTLLPGSRKHVVQEVLRGQLEVAERIAAEFPHARFGVSVANDRVAGAIREALAARSGLPIKSHPGQHSALIGAADLVLVASGTTTLEVAYHGKPMIVMYNASRLFYHLIGRWMIQTPHLCLPNILAGREIVPEFMPYYKTTGPIAEKAIQLLRSQSMQEQMKRDLAQVVASLKTENASRNAAQMLLEMATKKRSH